MASIKTSIELYDNFSDPMMDIVNAANAGTIAIENVQSAMNAGVDMSGINRATAAMQSFENTMQAIEAPSFSFGDADTTLPDLRGATPNITVPVIPVVESQPQIDVPDGITVPVTAEVVEQPRIDVPAGIEVPVSAEITEQPQIDVPDGITVPVELSGVSESEKQIQDISTRLNNILNYQNAINNVGQNLFVMPGDSAAEITGINRELGQMQTALDYLKTNPFDLDSSVAQLQLGSLSSAIDNVIERQERLNDLMGNVPSQVYSATPTVQDAPQVEPTQAPVNVPFNWQADNMNVFDNTGIERFQQEIESANTMLVALNSTQQKIAETAASVDLFPANAVTDLSGMQSRLQAIQDRIVQIENNPLNMGTNAANSELEQLRGQLDQAVQAQQALNSAVDNMDVQAANDAYLRLSQTVSGTERYIRDNVDEQGRFNQKINEGTANADNLMNTIKSAIATYATVQTVGVVFDLSDTLTSTTARLSMMNDGVQTTSELINMVYAAAQDARGSFDQMADVVARFGNNARDAFGSSEEVVAFADLIQKQMTIAGASTQEAANAELQLSQALGSGVLRGDELNSIFEQAPNLIQNIADYLDVPIGQIREMAADGELSASVVKAAIFSAADDINSKFESMPQTFAQIWTSFQNTALMSFQPVLNRLNEIANSDAFQQFVNNAIGGLSAVASVSLEILNSLVNVAYVVANNWSWISPIIGGVTAALMVYYGWQLAVKAIEAVNAGVKIALAVASYAHAAATGAEVTATAAATAAQYSLNTAFLASPITWVVMGIIALIAVLLAVTNAIAQVTGVTQSGVGIITGVIAVGGAFILNTIISLINSVITLGVSFWNMLANFAAAFGLIFTDPIAAIEVMFLSLFNFIVSIVSSAAGILDTIFGSDLQSAVQGFQDKIQTQINTTVENAGGNKPKTLDPSDYTMDRISYGDAFSMGADFGDGVVGGISDFFNKTFNMNSVAPSVDLSDYTAGIGDGVKDIAGNTGAIKNSLDITDEDLKYLRDIAEQEVINRFTTAEVKIDMSGMNNNISNGMDLDGVVSVMAEGVAEAIDTAAEGVHE